MFPRAAPRCADELLNDVRLPRHIRAISQIAGVSNRSSLEGTGDFLYADTILDWYELAGLDMVTSRRRQWERYRMSVVTLLPVGYGAAALLLVLGQQSLALGLSVMTPLLYVIVSYAELRDLRAHQAAHKNDAVAYGVAACGGISCMSTTALVRVMTSDSGGADSVSSLYTRWLDLQRLSPAEHETIAVLLGEYAGTLGELLETVRSLERGR